jgi:hypothetical protein
MKFAKATLTLLFFAARASAWTVARSGGIGSSSISRSASSVQFGVSSRLYSSSPVTTVADLSTEVIGEEKTESFRLLFKEGATKVSPWHDIPLMNADGSYNMVRTSIPTLTRVCLCGFVFLFRENIFTRQLFKYMM